MDMAWQCGNATSNSLSVWWDSALPSSTLYEAQLALGPIGAQNKPFIATAVYQPSATLFDLTPGTEYVARVRTRMAGSREWSNLTDVGVTCSTSPLKPGQPLVLPPHVPPTQTTVNVAVKAGSTSPVSIEWRPLGSVGAWSAPVQVPRALAQVTIDGLEPSSTYEVRATAASGSTSDVVHFSTRVPGAANLTAFRISELCGATSSYSYDDSPRRRTCEPDNLYNHDSGSLLADVLFINGAGGSGLEPDFNGSVISRYCVSRVDRPYADYVSCNGKDTEHYACACNLFIDRCIGRLNTSSCSYSGPKRFMPDCHCSDASREASAQYIGKMPAFFPFPDFHHKAPFPAECSPVLVPPISESVYLGDWFSMPEPSECAPDTLALPGAGGCSWARRATHHLVHGSELITAGFNMSRDIDVALLRQNSHVVERVLAQHPARCCDC